MDNVSFTVGAGEFFALLGPNGAGKTTTIAILTTTLAPTSSSVRIARADLRRNSAALRRQIGVIFKFLHDRSRLVLSFLVPFMPSRTCSGYGSSTGAPEIAMRLPIILRFTDQKLERYALELDDEDEEEDDDAAGS